VDIYKDPTDRVDSLVEGSLPTTYELMELNSGEQAFMTTRPKLIQAGYTTLDKGSGTRFYCPALKGKDSRTQEKVSKWIQLLHKHPAYNKVQARDDSVQQYIIHKVPRALPASYVQRRAHSTTEDRLK